jgi:hypothetical protein
MSKKRQPRCPGQQAFGIGKQHDKIVPPSQLCGMLRSCSSSSKRQMHFWLLAAGFSTRWGGLESNVHVPCCHCSTERSIDGHNIHLPRHRTNQSSIEHARWDAPLWNVFRYASICFLTKEILYVFTRIPPTSPPFLPGIAWKQNHRINTMFLEPVRVYLAANHFWAIYIFTLHSCIHKFHLCSILLC